MTPRAMKDGAKARPVTGRSCTIDEYTYIHMQNKNGTYMYTCMNKYIYVFINRFAIIYVEHVILYESQYTFFKVSVWKTVTAPLDPPTAMYSALSLIFSLVAGTGHATTVLEIYNHTCIIIYNHFI